MLVTFLKGTVNFKDPQIFLKNPILQKNAPTGYPGAKINEPWKTFNKITYTKNEPV